MTFSLQHVHNKKNPLEKLNLKFLTSIFEMIHDLEILDFFEIIHELEMLDNHNIEKTINTNEWRAIAKLNVLLVTGILQSHTGTR